MIPIYRQNIGFDQSIIAANEFTKQSMLCRLKWSHYFRVNTTIPTSTGEWEMMHLGYERCSL